ncbi:hypothetical protein Bbelb_385000 [Branchiostoma belcheri]|nr:hypothetical protein Bbelb_385000 [Branchiostoma belcheri]
MKVEVVSGVGDRLHAGLQAGPGGAAKTAEKLNMVSRKENRDAQEDGCQRGGGNQPGGPYTRPRDPLTNPFPLPRPHPDSPATCPVLTDAGAGRNPGLIPLPYPGPPTPPRTVPEDGSGVWIHVDHPEPCLKTALNKARFWIHVDHPEPCLKTALESGYTWTIQNPTLSTPLVPSTLSTILCPLYSVNSTVSTQPWQPIGDNRRGDKGATQQVTTTEIKHRLSRIDLLSVRVTRSLTGTKLRGAACGAQTLNTQPHGHDGNTDRYGTISGLSNHETSGLNGLRCSLLSRLHTTYNNFPTTPGRPLGMPLSGKRSDRTRGKMILVPVTVYPGCQTTIGPQKPFVRLPKLPLRGPAKLKSPVAVI